MLQYCASPRLGLTPWPRTQQSRPRATLCSELTAALYSHRRRRGEVSAFWSTKDGVTTLSLSLSHVQWSWRLIINCRFSSVVLVGVYIPPEVNATKAINQLADQVLAVENTNPDSVVIVVGDFNHTCLSKALPTYKQHVDCPTHKDKTLDHCYTVYKGAYHASARAPLGKSDHNTAILIPAYRQKLKTVKPVKKTVKKRSPESTEALRGCFEYTDWSVFEHACTDLDEYTDTVTAYVSFCVESCIPTRTVCGYANDKPWFTKEVKNQLVAKDAAFMTRSSGGLSTTRAGRWPEPKQSIRTSWRISSPPTTLMLCGKAYRPIRSTRRNRRLSAATQRFQTDWTSSTPVLTGRTLLLRSPFTFPLPPRWLQFPLPDLPPQDRPASGHQLSPPAQAPTPLPPDWPLVISCCFKPPPPHPLPPDRPLVISCRFKSPPPPRHHPSHRTGLWSPAVAPSPPPPPTGPVYGHELSPSRPPRRSPSTSVPLRGVCFHLCCSRCSQMTACHQSPL